MPLSSKDDGRERYSDDRKQMSESDLELFLNELPPELFISLIALLVKKIDQDFFVQQKRVEELFPELQVKLDNFIRTELSVLSEPLYQVFTMELDYHGSAPVSELPLSVITKTTPNLVWFTVTLVPTDAFERNSSLEAVSRGKILSLFDEMAHTIQTFFSDLGIQSEAELVHGRGNPVDYPRFRVGITSSIQDDLNPQTEIEEKPVESIPNTFRATLSPEKVEQYPYPANLGVALMQSAGYLFSGTLKKHLHSDKAVPFYNVGELVGYITYTRQAGGSVEVLIEDVSNSHGRILTRAAENASSSRN